jgi:hypothetical protein
MDVFGSRACGGSFGRDYHSSHIHQQGKRMNARRIMGLPHVIRG